MYLSKNDKRVLKTLKSVQQYDCNYVYIDFMNMRAYCSKSYQSGETNDLIQDINEKLILGPGQTLRATLDYLCSLGLLNHIYHQTYQLTHEGWVNDQIRRAELFSLILTHVAFPSIVALITTLITLFITR